MDIIVRGPAQGDEDGEGYREVVQSDQGLWIYSATGWRRKGCVCPYLSVEKAGLSTLNEGQVVEYEEVPNKGKTSAENLKVQR